MERVTATLFLPRCGRGHLRAWQSCGCFGWGAATRAVREAGLTAVCSAGAFTERFPRFASKLARGAKVHEESGGGAVVLAWCFSKQERGGIRVPWAAPHAREVTAEIADAPDEDTALLLRLRNYAGIDSVRYVRGAHETSAATIYLGSKKWRQ